MPTNAQINAFTTDEKSTIRYLAQLGIIQPLRCRRDHIDENGNPCPMSLDKNSEGRYRAVCHPCVYAGYGADGVTAIRKDNWLEGSKMPLSKIVRFIYGWTQNWTSIEYCEAQLEMNHSTCVDWCGYLRSVCAWRICQDDEVQVVGPGRTVEIDETLFSRRKSHTGRILPAKWVFGGICREDKIQRFAVCVPDRTAATLLPIIRRWIRPGTRILTPGTRIDKHTSSLSMSQEARRRRNGNRVVDNESYLAEGLWRMKVDAAGRDPFEAIVAFWPPGTPAGTKPFFDN